MKEEEAMAEPTIRDLIGEVEPIVAAGGSEQKITAEVAERLRAWLAQGPEIDAAYRRPDPDRYVLYPLHVDPEGRFSIAAAVWNVGQSTPVHGHETWGVVGILSGVEREVAYVKPHAEGEKLVALGEENWSPGEVTVCCTTDDDVHWVACGGAEPCVGVHIYGTDIGTWSRRAYDPDDGSVTWFESGWSTWPPLSAASSD
jgi:predicted metal-dependent enzyme (double-stranded beta helix superfamily)